MIVMDYAPGGNLFDYLKKRLDLSLYLEEEDIIRYFVQIVRALHHIHTHNILHRDMKTHNILLDSTQKVVKICDFGISKFLTQTNAMTTVGTAHYMSPEVVEGKAYNKKSDVWSLGCILYELITLKRAFDGTSLSVILWKILKREIIPLPEHYSDELKRLTKEILNTDPTKRPDLTHILASPVLINQLLDLETYVGRIQPCLYEYKTNHMKKSMKSNGSHSNSPRYDDASGLSHRMKSVSLDQSSLVYYWTSRNNVPTILPVRGTEFITQVCIGRTKKLGLSSKGRVLMWESKNSTTDSMHASDKESSASTGAWVPRILGEFSGSNIGQVSCGDHFIVVRSVRGMLLTRGSGEHGCLGHGTTNESSKAKVVEDLVGCTVLQVSCGASHVMALTNDQQVFVWGKGSSGNLGLNDREERLRPTQIPFPSGFYPKSIICGSNYSFVITVEGSVYACGNNRKNKIALLSDKELNDSSSDYSAFQDHLVLTKITCKPIADHIIVSIGTGPTHTAFLTDTGLVFTAGSNKHSQLGYVRGVNDLRPALVEVPNKSKIKHIGCGDTYTIGVTEK